MSGDNNHVWHWRPQRPHSGRRDENVCPSPDQPWDGDLIVKNPPQPSTALDRYLDNFSCTIEKVPVGSTADEELLEIGRNTLQGRKQVPQHCPGSLVGIIY